MKKRRKKSIFDKYPEVDVVSSALTAFTSGISDDVRYSIRQDKLNQKKIIIGPASFEFDEWFSEELAKHLKNKDIIKVFNDAKRLLSNVFVFGLDSSCIQEANRILLENKQIVLWIQTQKILRDVRNKTLGVSPEYRDGSVIHAILIYRYLISPEGFDDFIFDYFHKDFFESSDEIMVTSHLISGLFMSSSECLKNPKECFIRYNTLINKLDMGYRNAKR